MKRKVNLLLILVLCIAIFVVALSACANINLDKAPDEIGKAAENQEEIIDKAVQSNEPLAVRFLFTEYMSSVFTAIPITEFRLSSIKVQFMYAATGEPFSSTLYDLKEEYVDEECRPLLSQPGKHTIKVTYPMGEGRDPAIGSFTLNLAAEAEHLETVLLKFNLNGGEGWSFGGETADGVISIRVQKDVEYTWEQFSADFIFKQSGHIVDNINSSSPAYQGQPLPFSKTSTEPIRFAADQEFFVNWAPNTVKVFFDLRAPNTELVPTADSSAIQREIATQDVVMFTGTIIRPDANVLNVYAGWSFAGWRDSETDKPWQFAQTVLDHDVTLYGYWVPRDYSLTIFTMGASFKDNLASTLTDAQLASYTVIKSKVNFDETTKDPNDIKFEGLSYKTSYDKYATELRIDADDPSKVINVRLIDVLDILEKAGGIFAVNGLYKESIAETAVRTTDNIVEDLNTYINWIMPASVKADVEKLSDYYINYAFKNGISVNADGSLSIDALYDASITELFVPATLIWSDDVERPVAEIGDKACLNAKSLVKVDLSAASNLKRIGSHAFALCKNLKTVDFGTTGDCAVEEIGEQAFASTPWEANYATINQKSFIIVNDVIYKYVGTIDKDNPVLDLTDEDFVVTPIEYSISAGCFAEATLLESIKLADNIKYIHNYAFRNLARLNKVEVNSTSKLYYIGEDAFHNCSAFLTVDNTNNVADGRTLVIGKVLYKMFDVNATTYTVQEGIETIAPLAFDDCAVLEEIVFEKESDIKHIGKDAFIETPWIRNEGGHNAYYSDGFTVVNHILAAFCSEEFTRYDITIPAGVTKIAEYAFNSYARYVRTVEFRAGVEEIENYAFAGASSMRSFIFTDVTKGANGLSNIPAINSNSFANSKGKLLSGVKFYFTKEVVDYLNTDGCQETNPEWYELNKLFPGSFAEETIKGIWINTAVVPSNLIKVSNDRPLADSYDDGLVIESSSGVTKRDTFASSNIVSFDETEGVHILVFQYKGTQANCHNKESDAHVFKYNLRYAVEGLGAPSTVDEFSCDGLTNAGNFWIEGFEGDVEGEAVPTFYTSHTTLDLSTVFFCYKDVFYADAPANEKASHIHKIKASRCAGYVPTTNRESVATFTFNFYDIGNYVVTMTYRGTQSLYTNDESGIGIYQRSSISIPLNGTPTNYLRNTFVYFRGQDGREQRIVFSLNTFNLESVDGEVMTELPTDKLGMHLMRVSYISEETDGVLYGDIVYNVVLEADNKVFGYEIINERTKTARITYCSNDTSETLVIPNVYKKGDIEYTIVEIADSVFEGFSALKTVYLPSTIKKIGANAFKNCTLLEQVYTATQTEYLANESGEQPIDDDNFFDMSEEITKYGTVEVTSLLFAIIPNTLVVPETMTWSETIIENKGLENEKRTDVTYIASPVFKLNNKGEDEVFAKVKGELWLFDSEYNRAYAAAHLAGKNVNFYTHEESRTPAAQSRFQLVTNSFVAQEIYITKYAKLRDILQDVGGQKVAPVDANGNIIVEPFFIMPLDLTIKNTATGETSVVNSRNARVAWKAGALTLGADDEILSYAYHVVKVNGRDAEQIAYEIKNKKTGESRTEYVIEYVAAEGFEIVSIEAEIDYISATDGELELPDGFTGTLYLPDTIYNMTTIRYLNGEEHNELLVVYKSGTELLVSTLPHAPSSLEYIGSAAFENCLSLGDMSFGDDSHLEDICTMAFLRSGVKTIERCSRLTEASLPEGLLVLNEYAFYHCENLETVNIPSTVTTLDYRVFSACESLTEITIPDSLVNFDYWAFNKCYGIETINMSTKFYAYVKSFRDTAWYANLTAETVGGVKYLGNVAVGIDEEANPTSISLRAGTIAIANEAFKENETLVSVTIPASVQVIGFDAFLDDINLKTINYGGTMDDWNAEALLKDSNWDAYVGVGNKATRTYDKDYSVVCNNGTITVKVEKAE